MSNERSITDLISLKGRVALITGAAGPIGRVIAETYAELGAAVALLDRPGSGAEAVARRITDRYGVLTTALHVDLSDEVQVRKVPQRVVDSCGRLDIVVNNAVFTGGFEGSVTPVESQSIDGWRKAVEINLTAPFLLVQQAIPALKASGKGSVINIDANYEQCAFGSPEAYAANKAGLLQMTRWLAATLAPQVRVNAIVARAEDVKGAATFLGSDLSAAVTGHMLVVDGG